MRDRITLSVLLLAKLLLLTNALHVQDEGVANNETYLYNVKSENTTLALIDYEQASNFTKRVITQGKFDEFYIYYKLEDFVEFKCDKRCHTAFERHVLQFEKMANDDWFKTKLFYTLYKNKFTIPDFDYPKISIIMSASFTDPFEGYQDTEVDKYVFLLFTAIHSYIMKKQVTEIGLYRNLQLQVALEESKDDTIVYVESKLSFNFG